VPPGLTADDIAHAVADAIDVAYGTAVHVRLVPANPIFRYGGVQHAAIITLNHENYDNHSNYDNHDFSNYDNHSNYDFSHDFSHDFKVVYDLEAQLHFTMHKINCNLEKDLEKEKQRMWRWALRGIVIQ
jgi:hypothetical protein